VSDASFYATPASMRRQLLCLEKQVRRHERLGCSAADAQQLRALEGENAKLTRVVADLTLDKLALQDVIAKKALGPSKRVSWWLNCRKSADFRSDGQFDF
jgi:hypothetical protein